MIKGIYLVFFALFVFKNELHSFGGLLGGLYKAVEDFDPEIRARKDLLKKHEEDSEKISAAMLKHKKDASEIDEKIARTEKMITLLKLSSDGPEKQKRKQKLLQELQDANADKVANDALGQRISMAVQAHKNNELGMDQVRMQINQIRNSKTSGSSSGNREESSGDNLLFSIVNAVSGNPKGKAKSGMMKAFSLGELKVGKQEMLEEMQRANYSVKESNSEDIEMSYVTYLALQKAKDQNFNMDEEQKRSYRYALAQLRKGQTIAGVAAAVEGSKEALIIGGVYVMNLQEMVSQLTSTMREIHHIHPTEEESHKAEQNMEKQGDLAAFAENLKEETENPDIQTNQNLSPAESLKQKLEQLRANRRTKEAASEK